MKDLTPQQLRALKVVHAAGHELTPLDFAVLFWPDHPQPMLLASRAGAYLWALHLKGMLQYNFVRRAPNLAYELTPHALKFLSGQP